MIVTLPREVVDILNVKCSSATVELQCEKDNYTLRCDDKKISLTVGNVVDIAEAAAKMRTHLLDEDWRYQVANKWQRQLLSDKQRQQLSDIVEDLQCCLSPLMHRWVVPGWDLCGDEDEEDGLV